MTLMKNIALPKRYELWEKLGIQEGLLRLGGKEILK